MRLRRLAVAMGTACAGLGAAGMVQLRRAHRDRRLPYRPGDWPPVPAADGLPRGRHDKTAD